MKIKLILPILLFSGQAFANQDAISKEFKQPTRLETLINEDKFNEALTLFDEIIVKQDFAKDLGDIKTQAIEIRRSLGRNTTTFSPTQQTINKVFEAVAVEMQNNINTIAVENYDIKPSIIKELKLSGDSTCKVEKSFAEEKLILVYRCKDTTNGYVIDMSNDKSKVLTVKSGDIRRVRSTLSELSSQFQSGS